MARSNTEAIVAHWHKLIENFEMSPSAFYDGVGAALAKRSIPGIELARVTWAEGGLLSPHRNYLRVSGDRHTFDMCAAPFGSGFFFSYWVTKRRARFVPLYLAAMAFLTLFIGWRLPLALRGILNGALGLDLTMLFGLFQLIVNPLILMPFAFLIVLLLVALAARIGSHGPEDAIMTVPLIGSIYQKVFAPETYYRIDTMLMFRSAVHAAMMEAIDGQTSAKGLRALTEDDRKPIFEKLL